MQELEKYAIATRAIPTSGGVGSTETKCGSLKGTILDLAFQGKDILIDLVQYSDGTGYPVYKDSVTKLKRIIVPWALRQGLRRNYNGSVQLTPVLAVTNEIVGVISTGSTKELPSLVRRWMSAHAEEMCREINDNLGRVRNPHSFNLVAAVDVMEDVFDPANFRKGLISRLEIGEVGLSPKVVDKLNNGSMGSRRRAQSKLARSMNASNHSKIQALIDNLNPTVVDGSYGIFSRYPTTDVIPGKVKIMSEKSKKDSYVVYVPADFFCVFGEAKECTSEELPELTEEEITLNNKQDEVMQFMKLIEGDNDGDCVNGNFFNSKEVIAQISEIWESLYSRAWKFKADNKVVTYLDHEDIVVDEVTMAKDKIEQKTWIGALSNLMYAGFAYLEWCRQHSIPVTITNAEWRDTMTVALEKCFDKKHNNQSDPRPLYGLLNAKKGCNWVEIEPLLEAQGLNIDVLHRMHELLAGASIRDASSCNTPYRIMHQTKRAKPEQRINAVVALLHESTFDETVADWFTENLIPSL